MDWEIGRCCFEIEIGRGFFDFCLLPCYSRKDWLPGKRAKNLVFYCSKQPLLMSITLTLNLLSSFQSPFLSSNCLILSPQSRFWTGSQVFSSSLYPTHFTKYCNFPFTFTGKSYKTTSEMHVAPMTFCLFCWFCWLLQPPLIFSDNSVMILWLW